MSKLFSVCVEIGGQELYVHGNVTKFYPATLAQPEEPSELEVVRIDLLTAVSHTGKTFLDITDLVEELGGNDLIQTLVEEAFEPDEGPSNED